MAVFAEEWGLRELLNEKFSTLERVKSFKSMNLQNLWDMGMSDKMSDKLTNVSVVEK